MNAERPLQDPDHRVEQRPGRQLTAGDQADNVIEMVGEFPRRRQLGRRSLLLLCIVAAIGLSGCAISQSLPATNLGNSGATLNGSVFSALPGNVPYWFEYGRTVAYGHDTQHRSITINDQDWHPVSEPVGGLNAGTPYHFRLCVQQLSDRPPYCAPDQSVTTSGAVTQLSIAAAPALYPEFDPAVSDYVTRCGSNRVSISVAAPPGTNVAIDGGPAQGGVFNRNVALTAGRAFEFSTTTGGQTATYHVRCLPADFPAWTYNSSSAARANFYITTPQNATAPGGQPGARYVVIFDAHGVPVWWQRSDAIDAKLLGDGTLAWYTAGSGATATPQYEVHDLNGGQVRTWRTVGTPPTSTISSCCRTAMLYCSATYRARERSTSPLWRPEPERDPPRRRDPGGGSERESRLVLEQQGPHPPGGDRDAVVVVHADHEPPRWAHGLRLRAHQLDRADGKHGRRVVPALRRRIRDRQVDRRHPLEARGHDEARVARDQRRPSGAAPRRAALRPPARRWDADHLRQQHLPRRAPRAVGGEICVCFLSVGGRSAKSGSAGHAEPR